jgi:antitoxin component YwqK of YwqJK toxin-antitoxin module
MKTNLLLPLLLFWSSLSFAQNLTLPELFTICNKPNWDEVNEYMSNKGWDYYESSKGDDTHYSTITWAFKKDEYSDKAQAWFYLFTYEGFPNKISYSIFNKNSFNTVKNGITALGMKLTDTSIEDNQITSKYSNSNFIVAVETKKAENPDYADNSLTAYSIDVIKKAGIYDDDNGMKKAYDDNGNLESEFMLKDGKLHGTAKSFYANGQISDIYYFVNGKKHGASKEYDEEGNLKLECVYANNKLNGQYKAYENGKLKITGNFISDKRNGLIKTYDEDGNMDKDYVLVDEVLNGDYNEYYYKEGKLTIRLTGKYTNDVKSGLWQIKRIDGEDVDILSSHSYVNGKYEGAFKEVTNDSIIFGYYKNGLLNGPYKIYTSLYSILTGEISGDTIGTALSTIGSYVNGLKSGYWQYYSITKVLIREGAYSQDKKTGVWKYYYDKYTKEGNPDELLPYSNQLYLTENYNNGNLNGKSVRYSNLNRVIIPCDKSKNKSRNPSDTCYRLKYNKLTEKANWSNDELNGEYVLLDSVGNIAFKGLFLKGEKDGLWIESYTNSGIDNVSYYIYSKGVYNQGKREGIWDEYVNENFIFTKSNYKNGVLNGKTVSYSSPEKVREEKYFEDGHLKILIAYDSLGSVCRKFEIISETENELKIRKNDFIKTGKVSQVYYMKKEDKEIDHNFFELLFLLYSSEKHSDGSRCYADGEYREYGIDNKILVEGEFYKKNMIGKWKYYYYDLGVYTEQYTSDKQSAEKYYVIISNQPFSGKFLQKSEKGNIVCEFKIDEGLRDGKSKYFDENGELVKTEKYKKGILE